MRQCRRIEVHQGMELRGTLRGAERRLHGRNVGYLNPISVSGKRIRRQADELRFLARMQRIPIQLQPFDPELQQLAQLLPRQPLFNGFVHIIILADDADALSVALYLSLIEILDLTIPANVGVEFVGQLGQGADDEPQAFLHRFSADLQCVRHRRQIDRKSLARPIRNELQ